MLCISGEINKDMPAQHYANCERNYEGAVDVYYEDIRYKRESIF